MKNKNYTLGLILVALGLLGIISKIYRIEFFGMRTMWPLFIFIPGLCFEVSYYTNKKNPGILVPGGILTTIGALFLFETFTRWRFSNFTWPIYTLAVAIGLFQLYWHGGKKKGLLIPVGILGGVSIVSFWTMIFGNTFSWLNKSIIFPIFLLAIGLYILFGKGNKDID